MHTHYDNTTLFSQTEVQKSGGASLSWIRAIMRFADLRHNRERTCACTTPVLAKEGKTWGAKSENRAPFLSVLQQTEPKESNPCKKKKKSLPMKGTNEQTKNLKKVSITQTLN